MTVYDSSLASHKLNFFHIVNDMCIRNIPFLNEQIKHIKIAAADFKFNTESLILTMSNGINNHIFIKDTIEKNRGTGNYTLSNTQYNDIFNNTKKTKSDQCYFACCEHIKKNGKHVPSGRYLIMNADEAYIKEMRENNNHTSFKYIRPNLNNNGNVLQIIRQTKDKSISDSTNSNILFDISAL